MATARRQLRKQWRTVQAESPPERHLLRTQKRGCQKLAPDITWGDAKLRHREPYGLSKPSAWRAVPPIGISYDEKIAAQPASLPTPRRVRFKQVVRFRAKRAGSEASSERDVDLEKVHAALGIPEAEAGANEDRPPRPPRHLCAPLSRLATRLHRHRASDEDKDLAQQWAAFEYQPITYESVWQPPPAGRPSALRRLWSRLTSLRPRAPAPPGAAFAHFDPLDSAPFPPLPRLGAKQYTPGTVGCETLKTDGIKEWQHVPLGSGKPPSRAMLYATRSWLYPQ